MKLSLLGTGSPLPSLKRASTGHLVEVAGSRIVVDLGPGACRRLIEAGVGPSEVTDVFVSHLHFDHIGDLPTLLFYCWDRNGGIAPLPRIHGPVGIRGFVDALFGPAGAFAPDLAARTGHPKSLDIYLDRGGALPRPIPAFEVVEFDGPGWTEGKGWRIGRFPVLHHQPFLQSFGFRIEGAAGVFGYTSDIEIADDGRYHESLSELARGADVLVHYLNAFDFAPDRGTRSREAVVGHLAESAGVDTLVTTHHGPAMDRPGVRERVLAALGSAFSGRVVWGEDLMTFEAGGGAP